MTAITIKQGTDSGLRWLVNDGATGLPWDFTGWTVRSQIRAYPGADAVRHEWSTALGNAAAGADGSVTLTWTAAETSAWDFTEGVYDLELITTDHKVIRLDSGRLTVSREVTR
jgi:hypothetical protein